MKADAIVFDHIEQQLELAGEMRKHVREILKRIWVFEELSGMSFLDQKNMLLDLLCDLSDFKSDAYHACAEQIKDATLDNIDMDRVVALHLHEVLPKDSYDELITKGAKK